MRRKTPLVLVMLLMVLAPAASALLFTTDPTPQTPVLDGWNITDPVRIDSLAAGADALLGIDREVTFLSALGDVDADGFGDVLLQHVDLETGVSVYTALAGPDLERVLWTRTPTAGTALDLLGDLDGDGLPDAMIVQSLLGEAQRAGQEVQDLAVEQVQTQGALLFEAAAGGSGAPLLDVVLSAGVESSTTGAALLDLLRVQGERTVRTGGMLVATGQGALMEVRETVETTRAGLLQTLAPVQNTTSVETDAVVRLLDLQGDIQGEITLEGPGLDPRLLSSPDLDLDGLPDAVLLQVQKVTPTQEIATVVPTVTALAGADASVEWEVQMDPLAGFPLLVPDLGDLDGDGFIDMAYHAIATTPLQADAETAVQVLSGQDGSVLASLDAAPGLTALVPFGLDVGGQAKALLLEGTLDTVSSVSLVGPGLEAVWRLDLDAGTFPINTLTDPFTGRLDGFTDWTGDGVPDLAVATATTVDPLAVSAESGTGGGTFTVRLHDGTDGTEVWSDTWETVLAAAALPDLTTETGASLAVVTGTGEVIGQGLSRAAGTTLTLVDATDAAGLWQIPLVAESLLAGLAGAALHASASAAGDIDGDGVEDLLLHVEVVLDAPEATPLVALGDHLVAQTRNAVSQAYVLSGATADTLYAQADVSSRFSASVIQDFPLELGTVTEMEAYIGQSAPGGAAEVPGVGLAGVLAAVVAVLLARRRQ